MKLIKDIIDSLDLESEDSYCNNNSKDQYLIRIKKLVNISKYSI